MTPMFMMYSKCAEISLNARGFKFYPKRQLKSVEPPPAQRAKRIQRATQ
jgi:hypothetical protein